jgi:hypothetical protein
VQQQQQQQQQSGQQQQPGPHQKTFHRGITYVSYEGNSIWVKFNNTGVVGVGLAVSCCWWCCWFGEVLRPAPHAPRTPRHPCTHTRRTRALRPLAGRQPHLFRPGLALHGQEAQVCGWARSALARAQPRWHDQQSLFAKLFSTWATDPPAHTPHSTGASHSFGGSSGVAANVRSIADDSDVIVITQVMLGGCWEEQGVPDAQPCRCPTHHPLTYAAPRWADASPTVGGRPLPHALARGAAQAHPCRGSG